MKGEDATLARGDNTRRAGEDDDNVFNIGNKSVLDILFPANDMMRQGKANLNESALKMPPILAGGKEHVVLVIEGRDVQIMSIYHCGQSRASCRRVDGPILEGVGCKGWITG